MLYNTVARNTGGGGHGIYVTSTSSLVSRNTILAGQTVGVIVVGGSASSLDATLWGSGVWANGTDWTGSGTVNTANNLWGNPAFVDPDNGDYHIAPGSDAIDACEDAGVYVDIDGEARPYGARFDIGADEWVPE